MDHKKLALIHIIKKELNLSDEEYRSILRKAAGVDSAKDLDAEKFKNLMNYFVRSKHYRVKPNGMTVRQKVYIKSLYKDLQWTDEHMLNFLHKYYHIDGMDKLSKNQASHVIESLKHIQQNH